MYKIRWARTLAIIAWLLIAALATEALSKRRLRDYGRPALMLGVGVGLVLLQACATGPRHGCGGELSDHGLEAEATRMAQIALNIQYGGNLLGDTVRGTHGMFCSKLEKTRRTVAERDARKRLDAITGTDPASLRKRLSHYRTLGFEFVENQAGQFRLKDNNMSRERALRAWGLSRDAPSPFAELLKDAAIRSGHIKPLGGTATRPKNTLQAVSASLQS